MRKQPTKQEVDRLKKAGMQINPEWVTLILLIHDAGIPPVARHLKRTDLSGDGIRYEARRTGRPVLRKLPPHVREHLDNLQGASDYLCPWLHSLSIQKVWCAWQEVQKRARCKVRLQALCARYCTLNRAAIRMEGDNARRGELPPGPETIEQLRTAGAEISPEWVTLIFLVHEAGIVVRTARHLQRIHLRGDRIHCTHKNPRFAGWRKLPPPVLRHLKTLPGTAPYFCPWLHSLSSHELQTEWRKVEKRALVRVPLNALTAQYRSQRQDSLNQEKSRFQRNPFLDNGTLELLKEEGARINPEWVTFLLLTHDAGILPTVARRLKRSDRIGDKVICQLSRRHYPRTRELPQNVAKHLDSLKHADEQYCPWLNSLSPIAFETQWKKVTRRANKVVRLRTLCFEYRRTHRDEIQWERAVAVLEALARICVTRERWLTHYEWERLRDEAIRWTRLPQKQGHRYRRKTRKQLVAGVKPARKESRGIGSDDTSLIAHS